MIKAYLAAIASLYEGEDIEVIYSIYEDQELLCKESVLMEYRKSAVVGQVALIRLLKELKKYRGKEIVIIVNDTVLYELVRGTLTTKNKDILDMERQTRKEILKFGDFVIKNVSGNHAERMEWKEALQP